MTNLIFVLELVSTSSGNMRILPRQIKTLWSVTSASGHLPFIVCHELVFSSLLLPLLSQLWIPKCLCMVLLSVPFCLPISLPLPLWSNCPINISSKNICTDTNLFVCKNFDFLTKRFRFVSSPAIALILTN